MCQELIYKLPYKDWVRKGASYARNVKETELKDMEMSQSSGEDWEVSLRKQASHQVTADIWISIVYHCR